eukprot:g46294.t1
MNLHCSVSLFGNTLQGHAIYFISPALICLTKVQYLTLCCYLSDSNLRVQVDGDFFLLFLFFTPVLGLDPLKGKKGEIRNWRPIPLLYADYRSKVIVNQVRTALESAIHPDQTCAVPKDYLKVLGIWFRGGGAWAKSWEERIAKVKQKLVFWEHRSLTIVGKNLDIRCEVLCRAEVLGKLNGWSPERILLRTGSAITETAAPVSNFIRTRFWYLVPQGKWGPKNQNSYKFTSCQKNYSLLFTCPENKTHPFHTGPVFE